MQRTPIHKKGVNPQEADVASTAPDIQVHVGQNLTAWNVTVGGVRETVYVNNADKEYFKTATQDQKKEFFKNKVEEQRRQTTEEDGPSPTPTEESIEAIRERTRITEESLRKNTEVKKPAVNFYKITQT